VTEALPETSVVLLPERSDPPVESAVILKSTLAFLTRLLLESRTIAEIVELLLVWDADPVENATTPGTACAVTSLALVATNVTLRVAAGLLPI